MLVPLSSYSYIPRASISKVLSFSYFPGASFSKEFSFSLTFLVFNKVFNCPYIHRDSFSKVFF